MIDVFPENSALAELAEGRSAAATMGSFDGKFALELSSR